MPLKYTCNVTYFLGMAIFLLGNFTCAVQPSGWTICWNKLDTHHSTVNTNHSKSLISSLRHDIWLCKSYSNLTMAWNILQLQKIGPCRFKKCYNFSVTYFLKVILMIQNLPVRQTVHSMSKLKPLLLLHQLQHSKHTNVSHKINVCLKHATT